MKSDLRVIKTQENIRYALLELLKVKPLETITIAELCRLAKINRGTFYLHYKDVHGAFERYFEEIVKDLKNSYEEPYFQTNFKIEHIESDMIKIFHHVKKYQHFYQIIFDESIPMMYYYKLFETIRSFMKAHTMSFYEARTEVQANYFLSYQTNAIMGILIEWHRQDYQTSPQELNKHLLAIIKTVSSL